MVRFTCAIVLFLVFLFCVNGLIENIWVASFKDKYYEVYVNRVYVFLFASVISFVATVMVVLWGRAGSIIRRFRCSASRQPKPSWQKPRSWFVPDILTCATPQI